MVPSFEAENDEYSIDKSLVGYPKEAHVGAYIGGGTI